MSIEIKDFSKDSKAIVDEKSDCIWVVFSKNRKLRPPQKESLRHLDFRLLGHLSRYLLEDSQKKTVTVVPTSGKLSSRYVALDAEGGDSKSFISHCEGMKFNDVLCFFEAKEDLDRMHAELKKLHGKHPRIVLGFEA